jgi:primosomal protein N' (replication factor Y)
MTADQPSAAAPLRPLDNLWEVAVALPLDRTLTYGLPPELAATARVGSLVQVPVGRREATGFLLGPAREVPKTRLRDIQAVLDPIPRFGPELVPLFRWLAEYYHYPLGQALASIIPGVKRLPAPRRERWAAAIADVGGGGQGLQTPAPSPKPPSPTPSRGLGGEFEGRAGEPGTENSPGPPLKSSLLSSPPPQRRLGPRAQAVLDYLRKVGPMPVGELCRLFPKCQPVLKRLAARGLVSLEERPAFRNPLESRPLTLEEETPSLVPDQEEARRAIAQGIHSGKFSPFLLHGVTASGKTEVYLAAAEATLAEGRQVLVLLPEIALTHPVAQAFRRRFGERVALLHSGISEAGRLDQWRRIVLGQVDIVVGARSAVFAPLPRPGLVVVDEEHDSAYKQEGGFLYQARDVALYRGKLAQAVVVLVSATPAITTFFRAREGKYRYLNLAHRVTPQALPAIHLINLREHRAGRGLAIISPPLAQALEEALARGEQALLFLNRRGYATVHFCLFCGHVFECRHCSVALTQHHAEGRLVCHYCGYQEAVPRNCPQCQSTAIKRYGVGTERVEAEARRLFPQARIARLDRDTAPHSGKAVQVLADFARGSLDCLVGTQMITKGHHFPGVTLVGVIAADQSLYFPEYHAGERTFQLLAQVAGRAGRGQAPGKVLIQTYHPEHYVFEAVKSLDYPGFYQRELEARRALGYPPFTRLALARLSGPEEDTVAREVQHLAAALKTAVSRDRELNSHIRILGPAPAGLARLKGRSRWQLLLKSYGRGPLTKTLQVLYRLWTPKPRLDLTLDIDPASLF